MPERIGAIDQRDVIEFRASHPLRLHDPEQTGVMQIEFGLRRQTPQLLSPGSAIAQFWNERFGTGNHGHISAVGRIRPRGQISAWLPTNTRHFGIPRYLVRHAVLRYGRSVERGEAAPLFVLPHRDQSCLTGRSYLTIVDRLITNNARVALPVNRIRQKRTLMDKTVGIVGLGIMGGAIARNLIDREWRVIGFDIDAARRSELALADVTMADDVRQLARDAPIIMTSLPNPAAVEDVAHAIANSGQSRRIVVELSTLSIADKLRFEAILKRAGHIALDCPLSGTGAQAKVRDLVVYASGDSNAIAQCMNLFFDFAKQSADLGSFGNGSRMKFIANHLVAIHNVATAEAMILAQRAGLDPKVVVDMVGPGAGGSRMFQMRAPMMVEGIYEPATMKVATWQKDMAIIAEFAEDVGCATPLFTLTQPVYTEAMAMGLGDQDTAAVFEVLKKTIITDSKSAGQDRR